MSAAVLRLAAEEMRQRAYGLGDSPWVAAAGPGVRDASGARIINIAFDTLPRHRVQYAEHVAAWNPAMAETIADFLENVSGWLDEGTGGSIAAANLADAWNDAHEHALKIARAFLGNRVRCRDCAGGWDGCDACDATGRRGRGKCSACKGSGEIACPTCSGRGVVTIRDAESMGWGQ